MDQRLSLITLGVADVGRARAFYERLGWRCAENFSNEHIAFFQLGGTVLGLFGQNALDHETGLSTGTPGGITLGINVRTREEVAQTLAEVVAAGGSVLAAPKETPWGSETCYVADLDGHPWEISWVPQFPLNDDGSLILPQAE